MPSVLRSAGTYAMPLRVACGGRPAADLLAAVGEGAGVERLGAEQRPDQRFAAGSQGADQATQWPGRTVRSTFLYSPLRVSPDTCEQRLDRGVPIGGGALGRSRGVTDHQLEQLVLGDRFGRSDRRPPCRCA